MSQTDETLEALPETPQESENVSSVPVEEPKDAEVTESTENEPKEMETGTEESIFPELKTSSIQMDVDEADVAPKPETSEEPQKPVEEEKKEDVVACVEKPEEDDSESNPQVNVEDVKSAQDEMNEVDVVVCGGCHSVFHFAEDLISHKPVCKRTSNFRNNALEMKPQVWAFLLWKNAQGKVNRHGIPIEESSWRLYQKWCKMPSRIRSAWVAAGETVMTYTTFGAQPSKESSPPLPCKVVTKKVEKDLSLPSADEEEKPVIMRRLVQRDHTGEIKEIRPTDAPVPVNTTPNASSVSTTKAKTLIEDIENIRNQLEGNDTTPESTNPKIDMQNGDTLREEEFVVEKIVSRRYNQKKKQYEYLLKWEGYPPEQNTWEPAENLETCEHLLKSFEESLAKQAAAAKNRNKMRMMSSPSNSGRPVRHSKAKALTQVKQWCGSIRPDDVDAEIIKRKNLDSDEDDFMSKRIKMETESDEDQNMAKILFTKQGGQSGIVKRVGRVGRPPKNPRPANGEAQLSPLLDGDDPVPDRLPISLLNRKPTVSNLSPVNQQVLVANAKGVLKVDPSQVPNLTSGVYIMSGKSIVKLDSVTPSKVVQLKQNQQIQQSTPPPPTTVKPVGNQVIPSSSGQVVMLKNSPSANISNSPFPRSGICRKGSGIMKTPTTPRLVRPAGNTRFPPPTSSPSPRMQSGIIPKSGMSGIKPRTNMVRPPAQPLKKEPVKKVLSHATGGPLKSGIHRKSMLPKEDVAIKIKDIKSSGETNIFEDLPESESSESDHGVQDDFPKDLPAVVPDSPPRPLTLCPLTGKVLGRAEGEPSPPPSPANPQQVQVQPIQTTQAQVQQVQTQMQQVQPVLQQIQPVVQQVIKPPPGATSIQIGGKGNKQLNDLIKSEGGGFITLTEAMPSAASTTTKALFVNTTSGVTTSEVVHSGIVTKLSPDSASRPTETTILPDEPEDMVTITGDDGLVYKVSNSDLGRLLGEGGDGEQCVYVTEGSDDGVLQLSNFGPSLTQVVNSDGETEYLMKEVAGPGESVVLGSTSDQEEAPGQVVAQLVEAGESLPGGLRRVVLLLPDGNLMVTEVDEEHVAALVDK